MKTKRFRHTAWVLLTLTSLCFASTTFSQLATRSMPTGIGRKCGDGTATSKTSDSVQVFNFDDATNICTQLYKCKPSLASPSFSPYAGSVAFNPTDQNLYYIETTSGTNSYIWRWSPNACPVSSQASNYNYAYYIVGVDFNPVTGDGYQLEFVGTSAPYKLTMRKVTFGTTPSFGPVDTLVLSSGKKIYQQSGDIVFTPLGQLYFAFDNKLFQVDYSNYGPSQTLNATYKDTLALGTGMTLLGMGYAHGKFIASCQNSNNTSCSFKEVDISSGSAVISNLTMPAGSFTGTDMASVIAGVGAAKRVAGVNYLGGNNYVVYYDVKTKVYGNTNLTNVQLTDDYFSVFGAAFVSASASIRSANTSATTVTLNPAYNGKTVTTIFAAGSSMKPTPTDSITVRIAVTLSNPSTTSTYYSSAIASASSIFSTTVSDSSNQSTNMLPDIDFNAVPDDANEDIPTPLNFSVFTTLPFKMTNFNGVQVNHGIQLSCDLLNSESSTAINVQRSVDATNFETFASMEAKISRNIEAYQWLDLNASRNVPNYYRLQFVRKDGTVSYSETVRINSMEDAVKISASPNPFTDVVTMDVALRNAENFNYSLVDLAGKVIRGGTVTGKPGSNLVTMSGLSGLQKGLYLLQVKLGGEFLSQKIIKM